MKRMFVLALLLPLSAACLVRETRHVLYLDPDGAVTWTVMESGVRSDAQAPADRDGEEMEYLGQVKAGDHDIIRALAALGPRWVDSRTLRDERPFAVWSQARYDSVADLSQRILDRFRVPGQAACWRSGADSHFELVCHPELAPDGDDEAKILYPLVEDLDAYHLVLTRGRFTHAEGFRIDGDGRVATLMEPDEQAVKASGGEFVLRLTWRDEQ